MTPPLRAHRLLIILVAATCYAIAACSSSPAGPETAILGPGAADTLPLDTGDGPTTSQATLIDRSGPWTLTVSHAFVGDRLEFELTAPTDAAEVQIATEPTFADADWQPIGALEFPTLSTGVQELFVRYQTSRGDSVGELFVSAFDIAGPRRPMTGDDADAALVHATRVAPSVIQLDFEVGAVAATETGPKFVAGPSIQPLDWSQADLAVAGPEGPLLIDDVAVIATPTGHVGTDDFSMRYQVHLRLADRVPDAAQRLTITAEELNGEVEVDVTPQAYSPAVRVPQFGWGQQDPKAAYLSTWSLLDTPIEVDGHTAVVYNLDGDAVLEVDGRILADDQKVELWRGDLTGAPTASFDLSALQAAGTYAICIDQVGCALPVRIDSDGPWQAMMATVSRSLFHQRSGVTLELPHTALERPRAQHPDDGIAVRSTDQTLLEDPNGRGDGERFVDIEAKATNEVVDGAWGGHFDAGDWDRRIQHLWMARRLIDLVEMFPQTFDNMDLSVPESGDEIPDLLDEAMWSIDLYRRMQTSDGGIRGGIESDGHPNDDETSWTTDEPLFAYAPDIWSSYIYAAAAADLAYSLERYGTEAADGYRQSAIAAMNWADGQPRRSEIETSDEDIDVQRAIAAVALYRLTEDETWHQAFRESTTIDDDDEDVSCVLSSLCEAAWLYATLPDGLGESDIRQRTHDAIVAAADQLLRGAATTRFQWVNESVDVELFYGLGPNVPHTVGLMRAHFLTGDDKYRDQAVHNASFSLGANPTGGTTITGVGLENPKRIVGVDQQNVGHPVSPGTPLYGIFRAKRLPEWYLDFYLREAGMHPDPLDIPTLHTFVDLGKFPGQAEFTIHQTHAETIWTFGMLAATAKP